MRRKVFSTRSSHHQMKSPMALPYAQPLFSSGILTAKNPAEQ
jgi:hypothetical protein